MWWSRDTEREGTRNERERKREREKQGEREKKIGVETRIEGMGDTAGEGGTKKKRGYGTEMHNHRQVETLHNVNAVSSNTAKFNNVLLNKSLRNQVSMR